MKATELSNRNTRLASVQAILAAMFLFVSPNLAWSHPETEGDKEVLSASLEASSRALDSELNLEDWMIRPFDVSSEDLEEALFLEDWMTRPFDVSSQDLEAALMLEDWMTRPF